MAVKVAIVDKAPSKVSYKDYFDFDFDIFHLCSTNKPKILKKDIELEFDSSNFDYIILIGAEACKWIGKITSVTKYQGYLVEGKFLPLANPAMIKIRPEVEPAFRKAAENITKYIDGTMKDSESLDIKGIQQTEEARDYILWLLDNVTEVALDCETSGLYPRNADLLGICISHAPKQGVYIDADCIDEELATLCQKLWDKVEVIFHNSKFDIKMLSYHLSWKFPKFKDTLLEHYLLDETMGGHALKDLAIKYTDLGDYDKELEEFKTRFCKMHSLLKRDFTYDLIPFETMWKYAATDSAATIELHKIFSPIISRSPNLSKVYNDILLPATKFLVEVEENGVPFSKERLLVAQKAINEEIAELESKIYDYTVVREFESIYGKVFNPGSPAQLNTLLFTLLGLAPSGIKTDTGANSTNEESLTIIAEQHPLPELLLKIRKVKKIKNTYIDKVLVSLDHDGRLRTNFNLSTTTSGRLSSSGKLNMQQLPRKDKRVKGSIRAADNHKIVSMDLGTAEMYVAAVLSGDKNLQKIFIDKTDYHGAMAVNKFGLPCTPNEVATLYPDKRQEAKTISFEILYKLNYNEPALKKFPTLKKWLKAREEEIRTNGCIYSIFGRKRRLSNVFSSSVANANHEVRSGINFLVQSISSDINLLAAIDMQNYIKTTGMKTKIFALVHDSVLAEVPDEEVKHYSERMTHFAQRDRGVSIPGTPIKVDIEVGQDYSFTNIPLFEGI